jgi:hypothetical protein
MPTDQQLPAVAIKKAVIRTLQILHLSPHAHSMHTLFEMPSPPLHTDVFSTLVFT